jgi:hypothetical protein
VVKYISPPAPASRGCMHAKHRGTETAASDVSHLACRVSQAAAGAHSLHTVPVTVKPKAIYLRFLRASTYTEDLLRNYNLLNHAPAL